MQKPNQPSQQVKPYNILNEPAEILEEAGQQIIGEKKSSDEMPQIPQRPQQNAKPAPDEVMKISRMQALEQEMKDISEQKKQEDLQKKIGEEQMKKQREEQMKEAQGNVLIEPITKPKRGLFAGFFGFLKRKQRTTEFGKTPTG